MSCKSRSTTRPIQKIKSLFTRRKINRRVKRDKKDTEIILDIMTNQKIVFDMIEKIVSMIDWTPK